MVTATLRNLTTGETWADADLNTPNRVKFAVDDQMEYNPDGTHGRQFLTYQISNLVGAIFYSERFQGQGGNPIAFSIPSGPNAYQPVFADDQDGLGGGTPCCIGYLYLDTDENMTNGWEKGSQVVVTQS